MKEPMPGAKRLFDIIVSFGLLVFLLPIMALIAIIVRLDGGSAIYSHRRIGKGGRSFGCLKFRSMSINSGEILAKYLEENPLAAKEWSETRKLRHDPRITSIGSFLRRSSLDEIPQLINVLRGDMSLVGPRPITEDELEMYGPHREHYLRVRPGITGEWQVGGRSDVSYSQRIELDRKYSDDPTMIRDVSIIAKTPAAVLGQKGAR